MFNRTLGEEEDRSRFRVEGGTIFNSVVRLCVVNLQPALKKFLKQVERCVELILHAHGIRSTRKFCKNQK